MRWFPRRTSPDERSRRALMDEYERLVSEAQAALTALVGLMNGEQTPDNQEEMNRLAKVSDERRRAAFRVLSEMEQFADEHDDVPLKALVDQQRQLLARTGPDDG